MTQCDTGLDADLRLVTRRSMPPLLENNTDAPPGNCAALLNSAIAARRAGNNAQYEHAMQRIVAFFMTSNTARTPQEVRAAFALSDIATAGDTRGEDPACNAFCWLDAERVRAAVLAPVDVTKFDLTN